MSTSSETYILFELAGTTYALPTQCVQHIEMLEHVTPVPNAAPFVEGVVFSRGQVVPAVNLRSRFGLARQTHTPRTRLMVLNINGRLVGLVVDQAREFRTIPSSSIVPIEPAVAQMSGNSLKGTATVEGRLILLPNLESLLEGPLQADSRPQQIFTQPQPPIAVAARAS